MGEGRASVTRRFNRIEREILRCVAAAETADFTQEEGAERAKVSGAFLADLWLGVIPGAVVHPFGIAISGLQIEGDIHLGGARVSGNGRDGLVGLMARDCVFDGLLHLQNAVLESMIFLSCTFDGALALEAAEIRGALSIQDCTFKAPIDLESATIAGELKLENCTGIWISLARAKLGDVAFFHRCRFSGPKGEGWALSAPDLKACGGLKLARCHFERRVEIQDAELQWVDFTECNFRGDGVSVTLLRCVILRACAFKHIRARGSVVAAFLRIEGSFGIDAMVVTDVPAGVIALNLNSVDVLHHLTVERCSLSEHLNLAHSIVRGGVRIQACRIDSSRDLSIDASYLDTRYFTLMRSKLFGRAVFDRLNVRGDMSLAFCGFLTKPFRKRDRPFLLCPEAMLGAPRVDLNAAQIDGSALIFRCHIAGQLRARGLVAHSGLSIQQCGIVGPPGEFSIEASGITSTAIVGFYACIISSGIAIPTLACSELQLEGCRIGPVEGAVAAGFSIWASDMKIDRRVSMSVAEVSGRHIGSVEGVVDFSGSTIGESVYIRSVHLSVAKRSFERGRGTALDLSRSRIGGNVRIADRDYDRSDWSDTFEEPPILHGCLVADGAVIEGNLLLHRTQLRAAGRIARPLTHYEAEERVGKRKRGVALSLRRTVVRGHLDIGQPVIEGLCDLRDADIGLIVDGSGERWVRAGIQPGQLLLDGLVYRDLDDVLDEVPTKKGKGWRNDAAAKRLAWLMLQFPDRKPNADLFVPQPYEQLARIMAAEGNERARRRVLVAKRDLQRRYGQSPRFEQLVGRILKITSDYGYSPLRAVTVLSLFIAFGTIVAELLDVHGAMVLANTDSANANNFNAFVYALDVALPIVDLNQDSVFVVDTAKITRHLWVGDLIVIVRAVYAMLGLVLASVTVLTLTGTLRDKD